MKKTSLDFSAYPDVEQNEVIAGALAHRAALGSTLLLSVLGVALTPQGAMKVPRNPVWVRPQAAPWDSARYYSLPLPHSASIAQFNSVGELTLIWKSFFCLPIHFKKINQQQE